LVYSPKKKYTNPTAECSVINPPTNSLSPSGKSKGGLLVSAYNVIKYKIAKGNKGIINHNPD
jgi:hypothetical protein